MERSIDNCVETITFTELDDFFEQVLYRNGELYNKFNEGFVYRGLSDEKYPLLPKVLRENGLNGFERFYSNKHNFSIAFFRTYLEMNLLNQFYYLSNLNNLLVPEIQTFINSEKFLSDFEKRINSTTDKWISEDYIKLAVLAQHYGLPTRLLDWTKDINVALYFAVIDHINKDSIYTNICDNIVIWVLNKDYLKEYKTYSITSKSEILKNLIFIEDVYFKNKNLGAQKGLFTLWQIEYSELSSKPDNTPLDEQINNQIDNNSIKYPILFKLVIPTKFSFDIYKYLNRYNYNTASLFPSYNSVIKAMEENFYINEYNDMLNGTTQFYAEMDEAGKDKNNIIAELG